MEKTVFAASLLLLLAAIAALKMAEAGEKRYPLNFPSHCTCGYTQPSKKLGDSTCSRVNDPDNYPGYDIMNVTGDCLPKIASNQRLCYRTNVQYCDESVEYGCLLYAMGENYGFRVGNLSASGGNASSVIVESLPNTQTRTVCFYNVSVAENSAGNCSGVKIEHAADHPRDRYVDKADINSSVTANNSSDNTAECRSFVRIYFKPDGSTSEEYNHYTLCREELATFHTTLFNVTSLFMVYWTNSDHRNNVDSSFQLEVQCME